MNTVQGYNRKYCAVLEIVTSYSWSNLSYFYIQILDLNQIKNLIYFHVLRLQIWKKLIRMNEWFYKTIWNLKSGETRLGQTASCSFNRHMGVLQLHTCWTFPPLMTVWSTGYLWTMRGNCHKHSNNAWMNTQSGDIIELQYRSWKEEEGWFEDSFYREKEKMKKIRMM